VNVPIIGTVTAGQPILAVENIEGYFPIMPEFVRNKQTFMLNVEGDSMINAGILSGDYILVEQSYTALDGEIIVALIDDSVTVKRFYKEGDTIRLQPENDAMDPIYVSPGTYFSIVGKVIGLFRSMK
jgi:repressor LexA